MFLHASSRLCIITRSVSNTWLGTIVHHYPFPPKLHHPIATAQLPHTFQARYSTSPTTTTTTTTTTSLLFNGNLLHHKDLHKLYLLHPGKVLPEYSDHIYLLQHENDDNFHNGVFVKVNNVPYNTDNDTDFEVVGSSNGLVCLSECSYHDPVCVGNPVTGEYVWLPRTGKRTEFDIVSGIGFDQVANQFKVVRIMYDFIDTSLYGYRTEIFEYVEDGVSVPFRLEAKIHTIGSDKEWRRLGNLPYPLKRLEQPPVFANGALHFTIDDGIAKASTNLSDHIVAFDLGKEEFQLIPSPPGFISNGYNPCGDSLVELGGYLSYYCLFSDRCEIWVMKEYGHKGSWSKEYIIPREVEGFGKMNFSPLTLMKNGNILLRVEGRALVSYDPARKSFRKLEIAIIPPDYERIVTHVPSSVSLKVIVGSTNRTS